MSEASSLPLSLSRPRCHPFSALPLHAVHATGGRCDSQEHCPQIYPDEWGQDRFSRWTCQMPWTRLWNMHSEQGRLLEREDGNVRGTRLEESKATGFERRCEMTLRSTTVISKSNQPDNLKAQPHQKVGRYRRQTSPGVLSFQRKIWPWSKGRIYAMVSSPIRTNSKTKSWVSQTNYDLAFSTEPCILAHRRRIFLSTSVDLSFCSSCSLLVCWRLSSGCCSPCCCCCYCISMLLLLMLLPLSQEDWGSYCRL